jgi:hypothetical protein
MTDEERKLYDKLVKVKDSTDIMLEEITRLQRDFVVLYALKQGVTTEKTKMNVLTQVLTFISLWPLSGNTPNPLTGRLASRTLMGGEESAPRKRRTEGRPRNWLSSSSRQPENVGLLAKCVVFYRICTARLLGRS